jgi:NTP pyrophosphatase (non-canonical NTP hydrolase)
MPTLEEMKSSIGELVRAKGFGNTPEDFANKLLFAFIELGEAGNNWKKGAKLVGPDKQFKSYEELQEATAEEIIDAIFYELDACRVAFPAINLDEIFLKKLAKNWSRPHRYGEDPNNVKHAV